MFNLVWAYQGGSNTFLAAGPTLGIKLSREDIIITTFEENVTLEDVGVDLKVQGD